MLIIGLKLEQTDMNFEKHIILDPKIGVVEFRPRPNQADKSGPFCVVSWILRVFESSEH